MKFELFKNKKKREKIRKYLALSLEISALILLLYLVLLPFYPNLKYKLFIENKQELSEEQARQAIKEQLKLIKEEVKVRQELAEIEKEENKGEYNSSFPDSKFDVSPNRVIIPKIGVNAPIVVTDNATYGLSQGSWLVPNTSTPDKGGNTVLTGHRFKYLPPNNLTFYLFHKLVVGDLVSVTWKEKDYLYKVKETKVVDATDLSVLDPTDQPTLTMYTCTPIYSTAQRLVIVGELVKDETE